MGIPWLCSQLELVLCLAAAETGNIGALVHVEPSLQGAAKAEHESCFVLRNPELPWAGSCGVSHHALEMQILVHT